MMFDSYSDHVGIRDNVSKEQWMLFILHYAYPVIIFGYYSLTSLVAFCKLQSETDGRVRSGLIRWLFLGVVASYFAQLLMFTAECIIKKAVDYSQDTIIALLSSILVFGVEYVGLISQEKPVWYPYMGSIWLALLIEPGITTLSVLTRPPGTPTPYEIGHSFAIAARYLVIVAIISVYYGLPCMGRSKTGDEAEQQTLLPKEDGQAPGTGTDTTNGQANGYGSTTSSENSSTTDRSQVGDNAESSYERRKREGREKMNRKLKETGNWLTYMKGFLVFFPYIWPVGNKLLQLRAVSVGACLLAGNVLGLLVPRQLGIVIDSLDDKNEANPWLQVIIFAVLTLINSSAGLGFLRQYLWLPLEFYSTQAMATAAYSHVLNLSSDFHDSKSSSDIMSAISAGSSISELMESLCFQAGPMLIDFAVAFIYLSVTFGPYEGFITIATAIVFIHIASYSITLLKEYRRQEVSLWFKEHYVQQAGIQGWSTVASFNQVPYEEGRFSAVVDERTKKSMTVYLGYHAAYAVQFLILTCGLLAGLFLAVYQVTHGEATAGQFIMLLTYWGQLVGPLTYFSNLGKSISRKLVAAEQLLEIMQAKPSVISKEGAPAFQFKGGHVEFDGVGFTYDDKKEILKDITFDVKPGETIAFVGQTGAGKSTILKLLDRFYDVTEGSITIDGQDIREVDLQSLRSQIGVVQQTPILFDDTIINNVRYGKLDATNEEVYEACKAACIHDQIEGFTDGYNTQCGERGVKLSGGELQRVAIARAILKRPAIVLLDEATSAVDTDTEQKIQDAFRTLCKGRTTFVVAHRLSTIINADRIVVISKGRVAEQGSHEELIMANGKYAELWSKQIFIKPKTAPVDQQQDGPDDQDGEAIINGNEPSPSEATSDATQIKTLDGSSDDMPRNGDVPATPVASRVKEASRLNPDAPVFTPRSAAATFGPAPRTTTMEPAAQYAFSESTHEEEDYQATTPMSNHVHFANTPMVYLPAHYPVYTDYYIPPDDEYDSLAASVPTEEVANEEVPSLSSTTEEPYEDVAEDETQDESTDLISPATGLRYPRYSRRVQSKSEPSTSSSAVED